MAHAGNGRWLIVQRAALGATGILDSGQTAEIGPELDAGASSQRDVRSWVEVRTRVAHQATAPPAITSSDTWIALRLVA